MPNRSHHIPELKLIIPAGTTNKFTTLLQAGILEKSSISTTVGQFLSSLPGFTNHYILENVETIFLNGLPVDDLETHIGGPSPVLAISAAMPGLAGAIFRKNSFHAALRTTDSHSPSDVNQSSKTVMVKLKFFNSIASQRGETILHDGCFLASNSVLKFINYRKKLFSDLLSMHFNDKPVNLDDLGSLLHNSETVFLRIYEDNVTTI